MPLAHQADPVTSERDRGDFRNADKDSRENGTVTACAPGEHPELGPLVKPPARPLRPWIVTQVDAAIATIDPPKAVHLREGRQLRWDSRASKGPLRQRFARGEIDDEELESRAPVQGR